MSDYKRNLLINIGIFAAGVLVLGTAVVLLGAGLNEKASLIRNARSELAARAAVVSSLALLRSQKNEVDTLSTSLNKTVPNRDRLVGLLKEIEELAGKNGIKARFSFGTETSPAGAALGSVSLTMTADGSLGNIINFLKEIDGSGRLLDFSSFDIVRKNGEFSALINGSVFYRQ